MFNTPKLIVSSLKIISQYYACSNWGFRSIWGAVIETSAVIGAQYFMQARSYMEHFL